MYIDTIKIIIKAMQIIENNLNNDRSLIIEELEKELYYSNSYISELFKKELGLTTLEYVRNLQKESNADNQQTHFHLKSQLEKKLEVLEILDKSRIIKRYESNDDKIKLHLDEIPFTVGLLEIPVIIIPQNEIISGLIHSIRNSSKPEDAIVAIYIISKAFLLKKKEIKLSEDEIKQISFMVASFDLSNPSSYNGLQIYTVLNKIKLKVNRNTKKVLKDKDLFMRIATIYNLNIFNNNVQMCLSDSNLRFLLIIKVTNHYVENTYNSLQELIKSITDEYIYSKDEIFEALIELINEGIIIYVTEIQKKYFSLRRPRALN